MEKEILIIIFVVGILFLIIGIIGIVSIMNLFTFVNTFESLFDRFHNDLDDFNDSMLILCETLQTYHEYLDTYQLPIINYSGKSKSDW